MTLPLRAKVVPLVLALACLWPNVGLTSPAEQPLESKAATVTLTAVASRRLVRELELPAELAAFRSIALYPKAQGFVEWIGVDRASRVRQGEELVRLVAPELAAHVAEADAKIQMARAQRIEAEAKYAADQATYRRLRAAAKTPGVVAGNDVELAQHAAEAGQARAAAWSESEKAARDTAQAVRATESYLKVTAPFDGIITERNVNEGSLAGPGGPAAAMPMLRLDETSRLRLVVPLPESEVGNFAIGEQSSFGVSAYPGIGFAGVIRRPAGTLDVKTRTMPVELDVDNADGRLAPGMYALVRWRSQRRRDTLWVPASAIATTTERSFVIAVRDGKAVWVDVKRGATVANQVEVFGALTADDRVVQRGTDELRSGTPIRAADPSKGP
ncbi:MAG: efflux RND transporter periplasmic adaptor subunit [Candidatus Wallbacteria bacterium]|nr:efflux RND transporter periplasmic adaptor subunit [Candidatus Wallbacteria bacterium]